MNSGAVRISLSQWPNVPNGGIRSSSERVGTPSSCSRTSPPIPGRGLGQQSGNAAPHGAGRGCRISAQRGLLSRCHRAERCLLISVEQLQRADCSPAACSMAAERAPPPRAASSE